jgi:uptake hydrogenase large subunit
VWGSMSIEGRLEVILHRNCGGGVTSEIKSSRPLTVSSLLVGKTPSAALPIISSIYSVCGMAQSCAAVSACEHALSLKASDTTRAARQLVVWAETAREHILRIALDWGHGEQMDELKSIMLLAQNFKNILESVFEIGACVSIKRAAMLEKIAQFESFLESMIFGEPLDSWRQRHTIRAVSAWADEQNTQAARMISDVIQKNWQGVGGTAEVHALPVLDARKLFSKLQEPDFISKPDWQGSHFESTALSRQLGNTLIANIAQQFGSGLLARLLGMLAELSIIPSRMHALLDVPDNEPDFLGENGVGLAQVEAARGRLVHALQLKNSIISQYWILAPTEWNFHPIGPAAQALNTLTNDNESEFIEQARLIVTAIDPCVAFDVRVA